MILFFVSRDHVVYIASCPEPYNFDDHLSSCPRTLVPLGCWEWTCGKIKVATRGEDARGDKEKLTALSEGGEEDGREKERKRGTGEGKFGGDFQVRRVAHVKAIHSITLWGHRELPLPLRFAPTSCVYTLSLRAYIPSDPLK